MKSRFHRIFVVLLLVGLPLCASAEEDDPAIRLATQLQDAFAAVADKVGPSVVSISVFTEDPDWTRDKLTAREGADWVAANPYELLYPGFRRTRAGSGVVVSSDGYILTTHDNLIDADGEVARILDVELPGDVHALANVAGAEPTINLAVLSIEVGDSVELTPATLGDSDAARVGHWAIAMGDPYGAERTYAAGTIAAQAARQCYQEELSRTLMQSSVRIHPEAYGGPLVDIRGQVIGINVPRPLGETLVDPSPGSEYALPINLVTGIYEALKEKGSTSSPWLGTSVLELDTVRRRWIEEGKTVVLPETKYYPGVGIWVDNVYDPSPASKNDIRVGDFLVKIDGNFLFGPYDFQKWIYLAGIGETIRVELFRDGESLEVEVVLEERPASATPR